MEEPFSVLRVETNSPILQKMGSFYVHFMLFYLVIACSNHFFFFLCFVFDITGWRSLKMDWCRLPRRNSLWKSFTRSPAFLVYKWWIAVRDFWNNRCLTYKGCTFVFHISTLSCRMETFVFLGIGRMEKPLNNTEIYIIF